MRTTFDRIMSRTEKNVNGCLLWKGSVDYNNYPLMFYFGRTRRVYRVLYRICFGTEIPTDIEAHHTCKNRKCLNMEHILFLTEQEHYTMEYKETSLFCSKGHFVVGENAGHTPATNFYRRYCKICNREKASKYYYIKVLNASIQNLTRVP